MSRKSLVWILLAVLGIVGYCVLAPIVSMTSAVYDIGPDWSTDGKAIVFVCYKPTLELDINPSDLIEQRRYYGDIPYKPQDAEICSMAPDGNKRRQLTRNRAYDQDPMWSPDGTQIAFISDRDGSSGLYLMKADGSQQRRIAAARATRFRWSADGTKIVFVNYESIYLFDMETGKEHLLAEGRFDYPAWSPDGTKIAVVRVINLFNECELKVIDANTNINFMPPRPSICARPAWSPDGTHLAFVTADQLEAKKLFVLNLQSLEVHPLIEASQWIHDVTWSPQGDLIYYTTYDDGGTILVVRHDGSGQEKILSDSGVLGFSGDQNLLVSSDGKQIVFVRGEGKNAQADLMRLWKVNSDGTGLRRLSP